MYEIVKVRNYQVDILFYGPEYIKYSTYLAFYDTERMRFELRMSNTNNFLTYVCIKNISTFLQIN